MRLLFRAALAAGLWCGIWGSLQAQQKSYRPLPRFVEARAPDQAEGKRILAEFRRLGSGGEGFFTFEFRVMPRRGQERRMDGWLWRGSNATGPISRIVLAPGQADREQRWLVQNGPRPAVWSWSAQQPRRTDVLGVNALFEPIAGTEVTAFDLQMPFLFWEDFVFEGVTRVRGRPTHVFLLYPPADFTEKHPGLSGVRVYLDLEYHAMVQAEQIGTDNRPIKTMTVMDLKRVGGQWIVKSIDLRNEETRDKTRFSMTGAAVDIQFAGALFDPGMLGEPIRPPAPAQIELIGP